MAEKYKRKDTYKLVNAACDGEHDKQITAAKSWMPNVIIIGAPKSATTALTAVFQRHPLFTTSFNSEPNFFGPNYYRGWKWYRQKMGPGFKKGRFRCESSTMYSNVGRSFLRTPELISRASPKAKIIYVVRNPLDRIVSQWRHLRGKDHLKNLKKFKSPPFERVFENARMRNKILNTSMYYTTLMRYKAFFPGKQIHCMTFEDLTGNPARSLVSLFEFLGIDPSVESLLERDGGLPVVNEAGTKGRNLVKKPQWTPVMKKKVLRQVQSEADAFLSYLGKPPNYWTY